MMKFHIVWTVALLIAFIGIVYWAYSSRQKDRFTEAARLPLDDDEDSGLTSKRESNNG